MVLKAERLESNVNDDFFCYGKEKKEKKTLPLPLPLTAPSMYTLIVSFYQYHFNSVIIFAII